VSAVTNIRVTEDTAGRTISRVLASLQPEQMREMNRIAGERTIIAVKEYYLRFGAAGGWENRALPTHGPGRERTRFSERIVNEWNQVIPDSAGFTLVHNDTSDASGSILGHKIRGGTIRAKKAGMLTIPNVPEAHGKRVAQFKAQFGMLFRPKGRNFLSDGKKLPDGRIRAVYVLKKEVTQAKVPGAKVPDQIVSDAAAAAYAERIDKVISEDNP